MNKKNFHLKNILAILLLCITACSSSIREESSGVPNTVEPVAIDTPDIDYPPAIPSALPTESATPSAAQELIPTHTPLATQTTIPTSIPKTAQLNLCPSKIGKDLPPVWSEGSVLFNTGATREGVPPASLDIEDPGIWAISSGNSSPQLISNSLSGALISPDGDTLFYVQSQDNGVRKAVFHNILTDEIQHIEFLPTETLFKGIETWLSDGRVQYETVIERTEGVGEFREVFIFDPATEQVEKFIEELKLPDYTFDGYDIECGISSGYNALDPTRQLVLYSARKSNDNGIVIRLLNRRTNQVLWEQDSEFIGHTAPEWSLDGNHLIFEIGVLIQDTQYAWGQIISLAKDGKPEDISSQPFPKTDEHLITSLSRSPSGRYIFYTVFDFANQTTHGFIVDTIMQEVNEICDPEVKTFVTSYQGFVKVHWIHDDFLIYSVISEQDGEPIQSLRVLDIPNWATQIIYESKPNYGIDSFGWTPVVFHKP